MRHTKTICAPDLAHQPQFANSCAIVNSKDIKNAKEEYSADYLIYTSPVYSTPLSYQSFHCPQTVLLKSQFQILLNFSQYYFFLTCFVADSCKFIPLPGGNNSPQISSMHTLCLFTRKCQQPKN